MDLHAHQPIYHIDAFFFHLLRPGDVALLIETGFQLYHGSDLLASAAGLDQRLDDGGVVPDPVQSLLDRDNAGVFAGPAEKLQHGGETVIRMIYQRVPFLQVRVDVALLEHARHAAVERGKLEARPVQAVQGNQFGEGQRSLDPINLKRTYSQVFSQKGAQIPGHAVGDLKPHHIAEAALIDKILDGLQQIVGLLLLDFHISIARDAELARAYRGIAGMEDIRRSDPPAEEYHRRAHWSQSRARRSFWPPCSAARK